MAAAEGEIGTPAERFAVLTRGLLGSATVTEVFGQVTAAAVELVPAADAASVTLRGPDGQFHTPVGTDPLAAELDRVQYGLDEGPGVEAARMLDAGIAHSDDMLEAWPRFGPAAAVRGVTAVLAASLQLAAQPLRLAGALNLYTRRTGGFGAGARDTALLLVTHASLAVARTQAAAWSELQIIHLQRALDGRDVIGQAKGILMQQRGLSADEAFDLLRRTSQRLNVKLATLAATVAARQADQA
ncbi:GAF and ANTAR domain-containing protein [Amycolatopsis sp. WQ 127309]|uniref:GAF and ANTAR domain-containing protein n=1 Tax=Amycolatopsis sp. WQ 127309 TaxID=2932773 RepID=UPI001FF64FEB|nr:GAF and ANTAR domain-containing protein [Amycolatopsis sp. WQ 127309]UOZ10673.1 GAF and ANTAR domain-containing protein [Amycolatopsis sp. WQ 127309]